MPEPISATVATVATVGGGIYSAQTQADAAKDAAKSAERSAAANLAFQREQYQDWQDTFGPIQDTLSDYYKGLSPESFEAQQVNALQRGYEEYAKDIDAQLAQRGISSGGLHADLLSQGLMETTRNQALAGINAEQQVRGMQQNFLNAGLGLQPSLQAGVSSAYGNQSQMYGNMANTYAAGASNAMSGAMSSLGGLAQMGGYYYGQQSPTSSIPFTVSPTNTTVGGVGTGVGASVNTI